MLTLTLNPGLALIIIGLLVLAAPRVARAPMMAGAALLALWLLLDRDFGAAAARAQMGLEVVPVNLNALNRVFGIGSLIVLIALAVFSSARRNRYEDAAILILHELLRRFPTFLRPHYLLGIIHDDRGQNDLAYVHWSQIADGNELLHGAAIMTLMKSPLASSALLADAAREWARRHGVAPLGCPEFRGLPYDGQRKIRLAYSCSFWNSPTILAQLVPVARAHDRRRRSAAAARSGRGSWPRPAPAAGSACPRAGPRRESCR